MQIRFYSMINSKMRQCIILLIAIFVFSEINAQEDLFTVIHAEHAFDSLATLERSGVTLSFDDEILHAQLYDQTDQLQSSIGSYSRALSALYPDTMSLNSAYIHDRLGYIYFDLDEIEKSVYHLSKSIDILHHQEKSSGNNLELHKAMVYFHIARTSTGSASTYSKSVAYADSAITCFHLLPSPPSELARSFMIKGVALEAMDKLSLAKYAYDKAHDLSHQYPEDQKMRINIYKNLGNYYLKIDEDPVALTYYNRALAISLEINGADTYQTNSILNNIAYVQGGLKQYEQSLTIYNNLLQSNIKLYGADDAEVASVYQNLGNTYSRKGDQAQAIQNFKRAENIYIAILPPLSIDLAINHLQLGEAYQHAAFYVEALDQFRKTENIAMQVLGPDHIIIAACKYYAANVNADMGNYDLAFDLYDETKILLGYHANDLTNLKSYTKAAELHFNIANTYSYWYEESENDSLLLLAQTNYHEGIRLINIAKGDFENRNSSEFIVSRYRSTYESYLLNEYRLNKSHLADNGEAMYLFIDNLKNTQLKEAVLTNDAIRYADIPDSLIQEEENLARSRYDLLYSIEKLESHGLDSIEQLANSRLALANTEASYKELSATLQENFPSYYDIALRGEAHNLDYLKSTVLQDGEVILNFFLEKDYIFIASIGVAHEAIDSVHLTTDLVSSIESYINDLQDYSSNAWMENSQYLYRKLLSKIIEKIPTNIHTLTIQPDGILSHIPFETLNYSEHDDTYLIHHYNVKYDYNSKLSHTSRDKISGNGKILAIAPSYHDNDVERVNSQDNLIAQLIRSGVYELPGAITEVQTIGDLLNADLLVGSDATVDNFKAMAGIYSVLHLSMHAIVDRQNPLDSRLLFTPDSSQVADGQLYAYELYGMNVPAELAVLSACNTGVGKVQHGEGIMSLNRAFSYAGVSSIVMSLWQVPDGATASIMATFYGGLSTGLSRSEALRTAKLSYLRSEIIPERRHPFYWSGFIFLGVDTPMHLYVPTPWWIYAAVALIILAILFFIWKKIR